MAVITAIANGNWSSAATWDLGRIPVEGDDVRLADKEITLDVSATPHLLAIRGQDGSSNITAAALVIPESVSAATITADTIQSGLSHFPYAGMIDHENDGSLTISGNLYGAASTSSNAVAAVYICGGSLLVNGSATGGAGTYTRAIYADGYAPITLNGSAIGSHCPAIWQAGLGAVTINGSVISGLGGACAVYLVFPTATVSVSAGNIVNELLQAVYGQCVFNPAPGNYVQYPGPGGTTVSLYLPFVANRNMVGGYES